MNELEPNLANVLEFPVVLAAEIGSTRQTLRDLLALKIGSVVVLDETSDSAVILHANGKEVARGEIVISNGNFGVQITALRTPSTTPAE